VITGNKLEKGFVSGKIRRKTDFFHKKVTVALDKIKKGIILSNTIKMIEADN
jgi:hypothetical protein